MVREETDLILNSCSKDISVFNYFNLKKKREKIKGLHKSFFFKVGDILNVVYLCKNLSLINSGICIAIKKIGMLDPDTGFIIRNIIMQVGIELTFSFYYNRVYNLAFLDYKRKFYMYRKNRLFFLRYRVSRESKI